MILMKDVIREGDETLKKRSFDVEIPLGEKDKQILDSMIEYVKNSLDEELAAKYLIRPAVGIAAVQIGVLKRILVIRAHDEDGILHFYAMVNPKIVSYSQEKTYLPDGEGCLSVDREVEGYIHRARRVTVSSYLYKEVDGAMQLTHEQLRLKNYIAIIFQHEYDHLNGVLFTERVNYEKPFDVPRGSVAVRFKDILAEDDK